jgi:predicted XRE-type DNA-binding protein
MASPSQTQRWLKCILNWAKTNRVSHTELCDTLGFASRTSLSKLMNGKIKRARIKMIHESAQQFGLDINFINGIFDYKSKFSEVRNIFYEFKEAYANCINQGQLYQAAQIVRKAANFVYEALVPKDIIINLELTNRKNEVETAVITCSADELEFFRINVYGGNFSVMFNMTKIIGSMEIGVMEGDLDAHAVSAIRHKLSANKKRYRRNKKEIDKFEDNAKRFAS